MPVKCGSSVWDSWSGVTSTQKSQSAFQSVKPPVINLCQTQIKYPRFWSGGFWPKEGIVTKNRKIAFCPDLKIAALWENVTWVVQTSSPGKLLLFAVHTFRGLDPQEKPHCAFPSPKIPCLMGVDEAHCCDTSRSLQLLIRQHSKATFSEQGYNLALVKQLLYRSDVSIQYLTELLLLFVPCHTRWTHTEYEYLLS